jgi:hypothetical protein
MLLISGYGTEQLIVPDSLVVLLQKRMTRAALGTAVRKIIGDAPPTAAPVR